MYGSNSMGVSGGQIYARPPARLDHDSALTHSQGLRSTALGCDSTFRVYKAMLFAQECQRSFRHFCRFQKRSVITAAACCAPCHAPGRAAQILMATAGGQMWNPWLSCHFALALPLTAPSMPQKYDGPASDSYLGRWGRIVASTLPSAFLVQLGTVKLTQCCNFPGSDRLVFLTSESCSA